MEVYPGHVAGSLCGAAMSSKASTTVGFERRFNSMLAAGERRGLRGGVEDGELRPAAAEHGADRRAQPRGLRRRAAAAARDFLGRTERVILDVRDADSFGAGHVPGAISVPLSSSAFGTKAGFVLLRTIAWRSTPRPPRRRSGRDRLYAVGFLELEGRLEQPEATATMEPVEIDELERLLAADEVGARRRPREGRARRRLHPRLAQRPYRLVRDVGGDLADGKPVVTICESGARAGIAASVLEAQGVDARPVLHGGIGAWERTGHETVQFRRCGS